MLYKRTKIIFLLALLSISYCGLQADEITVEPSSFSSDIPTEKRYAEDEKRFLPPYYEKEKSGPFISTNTGLGLLFNQSKYVLFSPAYEAIVGYHVGNSFKIGVTYQYQHAPLDVEFKGTALIAGKSHDFNYAMESGLSVQALAFKLYTSPPHPYRWKIFTLSPYFSVGTGLGWADMKGMFQARRLVFMGDVGFSAGTSLISTTAGCKYNSWSWDHGIYSITPYVGLQLSF